MKRRTKFSGSTSNYYTGRITLLLLLSVFFVVFFRSSVTYADDVAVRSFPSFPVPSDLFCNFMFIMPSTITGALCKYFIYLVLTENNYD